MKTVASLGPNISYNSRLFWLSYDFYWVLSCLWTAFYSRICLLIIHQIFPLMCDCSKRIMWPIFPSWGISKWSFPIFKTVRHYWEKYLKDNKQNSFHLSLDIICCSKLTLFLEPRSQKTIHFSEQTMSVDKYPSIFPNQMEAIEGGKGYFRDSWSALFFQWNVKWLIFSSWIVISIVAVNRDFPKRSLSFSVKHGMPMLYFLWIVKGLLYFLWNVIYTPPLPPSLLFIYLTQSIINLTYSVLQYYCRHS